MWKSGVKINQFIEADFIRHHLQMSTDYLLGATSGAGTAYASRAPECSPPVFSGVHVTRSLVLCVCFVDRCVSFCTFSFGHCVVCSSIYGFWLPLWYLQTLLILSTWLYLDTHMMPWQQHLHWFIFTGKLFSETNFSYCYILK